MPYSSLDHRGRSAQRYPATLCFRGLRSLPVYQARGEARAEAVVDVYYCDVGGAGVQHSEQGGEAVEGGAVAYRRRKRDHGDGDEAADDRGKRAFHAGGDDDDPGILEAFAFAEDAVDAGDAGVPHALDAVAHGFGG